MQMKKYKVGEICENITDGEHGTVVDSPDGEYFLLSNKNIVDGKIVINTTTDRRIDKQTFEKINKRTKLEKNDVLISTVGTLGKLCIIEDNLNYTVQRSVGIIKPNQEKLKSIFLKYLLMTDSYQNLLKNTSKGAIQKCIFIDDLKSLELSIPDISTQKKIASVLSSLDEKIALNRRINARLEQMAKRLYDYWFVQFDFPNSDGKPYKSSGRKMVYNAELKREIPEGWEVGNLYEIADYINGLACQNFRPKEYEESLPVIKIREMNEGITKDTEQVSINIPEKYKINNGDILFSWSATLEVMVWNGGKGGLNQHIFKVMPKNYFSHEYVYQQLDRYVVNFQKQAEARKTTMGHITSEHINQSRVVLPPEETVQVFTQKVKTLSKMKSNLKAENLKLASLRDRLLPLLIVMPNRNLD